MTNDSYTYMDADTLILWMSLAILAPPVSVAGKFCGQTAIAISLCRTLWDILARRDRFDEGEVRGRSSCIDGRNKWALALGISSGKATDLVLGSEASCPML